ncbi:MAG: ATP-binding protein, partial [Chloroflexota bacterium]|nr:ATP-binding protein [Chloroflexota bacterium]
LFTVPVMMASFILQPWASFLMAGVTSAIVTVMALTLPGYVPPAPTMLGFFAVALVSWLAARSLEAALQDLRVLNRDLELRVAERTRELEEANQRLEEANAHLRELDRLKSLFVAMVSHELRTPLTSIQGFTQMLLVGIYGTLANEQQSAAERVLANTRKLIKIVNDLLDRTRIEAGQLALYPAPFSLTELVEDVYANMKILAEKHKIELTQEIDSELPTNLYGDYGRLHQVLINLINNALKFTEKGQINIKAYRFDAAHWAMEVKDTGIGISEEDQKYIFEAFRQVDSSATRRYKGVGLGLSISQQLLKLMGGRIVVVSEVDVGSTFTAIIPFTTPHKEAT